MNGKEGPIHHLFRERQGFGASLFKIKVKSYA